MGLNLKTDENTAKPSKLITAKDAIVADEKVTQPNLEGLLQEQVVHEFQNERLYLSMALWCSKNEYMQTAKFFSTHALEERQHGMAFINAMIKQRMDVVTPEPGPVETDFTNLEDVLEKAMKREIKTSKLIAQLHATAIKEHSLISQVTEEYVEEQVEEEQLFQSLLTLFHVCDGSKIDFEMEVRTIKTSGKYVIGNL